MKLFLDTSVLLAGATSSRGATRYMIEVAAGKAWVLVSADYCVEETERNLVKMPLRTLRDWREQVASKVAFGPTNWALDRPLFFSRTKDRPVLISALAEGCDWLLTFDEADFRNKLGPQIYGMRLGTPGEFLQEQRQAGLI